MTATAMSLEQMQAIAVDLQDRVAALEDRELSGDSFAVPNVYFITNAGNTAESGLNWSGPWLTEESYSPGEIVQYGGHLYLCTAPVSPVVTGLLSPVMNVPFGAAPARTRGAAWLQEAGVAVIDDTIIGRDTTSNHKITGANLSLMNFGGFGQGYQFKVERKTKAEEVAVKFELFNGRGEPIPKPSQEGFSMEQHPGELRAMLTKSDGNNNGLQPFPGNTAAGEQAYMGVPTINVNNAEAWAGGAEVEAREFIFWVLGGVWKPEKNVHLTPQPYRLKISSANLVEPLGVGSTPPSQDPAHWEFMV